MIRIADSREEAFRSFILVSAISLNADLLTDPVFCRSGSELPFSTPADFRSRSDAGGVLVMNVKDRSSKTVI